MRFLCICQEMVFFSYKTRNYQTISESLDPCILSKYILSPILNIKDEKTDKNVSFYDGTIDLSAIKDKVDSENFLLHSFAAN